MIFVNLLPTNMLCNLFCSPTHLYFKRGTNFYLYQEEGKQELAPISLSLSPQRQLWGKKEFCAIVTMTQQKLRMLNVKSSYLCLFFFSCFSLIWFQKQIGKKIIAPAALSIFNVLFKIFNNFFLFFIWCLLLWRCKYLNIFRW